MNFWKDIWPTLIAPLIVLAFSPIAIVLGNKVIAGEWSFSPLGLIPSFSSIFIVFIFIVLAFSLAYFFTKGGGDISTLQENVQELINTIKPKK